ncbi:MAG: hypothetical protein JNK72_22960 [Myxococcales bacterium]|nr:hypothetical protein [Myxococcales bacterium]
MKKSLAFVGLALLVASVSAVAQVPPGSNGAAGSPNAAEGRARFAGEAARASGVVGRYLVGPFGHTRGLQLRDGTVVLFGRHGSDDVSGRLAVGSAVQVEGFRFAGQSGVIHHASLRLADGTEVLASRRMGPPGAEGATEGRGEGRRGWFGRHGRGAGAEGGPHHGREGADGAGHEGLRARMAERFNSLAPMTTNGRVSAVVGGPHGRAHLLVLEDGTTVMLGPQLSGDHTFAAGETLRVEGRGGAYPQGRSVLAQRVILGDGTVLAATPRAPVAGR